MKLHREEPKAKAEKQKRYLKQMTQTPCPGVSVVAAVDVSASSSLSSSGLYLQWIGAPEIIEHYFHSFWCVQVRERTAYT